MPWPRPRLVAVSFQIELTGLCVAAIAAATAGDFYSANVPPATLYLRPCQPRYRRDPIDRQHNEKRYPPDGHGLCDFFTPGGSCG